MSAPAVTGAPAIYEATVTHRRVERVDHGFTTRTYLWLVDLDDLPRLPRLLRPLARFEAADHFRRPAPSLRAGIDALLADHGVDLHGGRVLMLAHARVLGHVFNPLSLFWCHDADGTLACVVAEVHNTYGGRHHYLLDVDHAGRARVDKDFYVSPFFAVDGEYRMRVPEPGATLDVAVGLRREGRTAFAASLRGRRRPAGVAGLLRAALRHPVAPLAGAVAIRRQGITLWAKRVPVVPRPARDTAPASRGAGARG